MSLLILLGSCVEEDGSGNWLVRSEKSIYRGSEACPKLAQHKAYLSAAKAWIYAQEQPAVVSTINQKSDDILAFNLACLKLLGMSHEHARISSPLFHISDFWLDRSIYWTHHQTLLQEKYSETVVDVVSADGAKLGQIGCAARMLSPDSPIFVNYAI